MKKLYLLFVLFISIIGLSGCAETFNLEQEKEVEKYVIEWFDEVYTIRVDRDPREFYFNDKGNLVYYEYEYKRVEGEKDLYVFESEDGTTVSIKILERIYKQKQTERG